jgi:hypothetical protein
LQQNKDRQMIDGHTIRARRRSPCAEVHRFTPYALDYRRFKDEDGSTKISARDSARLRRSNKHPRGGSNNNGPSSGLSVAATRRSASPAPKAREKKNWDVLPYATASLEGLERRKHRETKPKNLTDAQSNPRNIPWHDEKNQGRYHSSLSSAGSARTVFGERSSFLSYERRSPKTHTLSMQEKNAASTWNRSPEWPQLSKCATTTTIE